MSNTAPHTSARMELNHNFTVLCVTEMRLYEVRVNLLTSSCRELAGLVYLFMKTMNI